MNYYLNGLHHDKCYFFVRILMKLNTIGENGFNLAIAQGLNIIGNP